MLPSERPPPSFFSLQWLSLSSACGRRQNAAILQGYHRRFPRPPPPHPPKHRPGCPAGPARSGPRPPTGRAAPRISRLWFFGVFGCTFGGRTLLTAPVQTDALSILLTLLLFVGLPGTTHPHLRSVEVQTWQLVAVHVQRSQQVWARSSRCSVSSSPITKASKPF